jgi:hypothetical protein
MPTAGRRLDLKGVGNFASVFRKLNHDLLMEPNIHGSRIFGASGETDALLTPECRILTSSERVPPPSGAGR